MTETVENLYSPYKGINNSPLPPSLPGFETRFGFVER